MSAEEKQAAPKVTFVFLAPLTNGPSAAADSGARQRGAVSEALGKNSAQKIHPATFLQGGSLYHYL